MNFKYIAGFLDAEGSIGITSAKSPLITFTNTNKEIIEKLSEIFGSKIRIEIHNNPNHKTTYRLWFFTKKDCKNILDKLQSFLIIKKSQGLVLTAFLNNKKTSNYRKTILFLRKNQKHFTGIPSVEYLSGFFDGEGHIGIKKRIRSNRANPTYELSTVLTNENLYIIKKTQEMFGGSIYKDKNRNIYRHILSSNEASYFLESMYPYLIVKKKEALLAIEFQKKKLENSKQSPKKPLTFEQVNFYDDKMLTISELKN